MPVPESINFPSSILEGAKASTKSVLEKMITAMYRGGDSSKRALLRAKDIEMFAKPKPETCSLKKSPIPLRAYVSSKAAKKPHKKIVKKKKAKR